MKERKNIRKIIRFSINDELKFVITLISRSGVCDGCCCFTVLSLGVRQVEQAKKDSKTKVNGMEAENRWDLLRSTGFIGFFCINQVLLQIMFIILRLLNFRIVQCYFSVDYILNKAVFWVIYVTNRGKVIEYIVAVR